MGSLWYISPYWLQWALVLEVRCWQCLCTLWSPVTAHEYSSRSPLQALLTSLSWHENARQLCSLLALTEPWLISFGVGVSPARACFVLTVHFAKAALCLVWIQTKKTFMQVNKTDYTEPGFLCRTYSLDYFWAVIYGCLFIPWSLTSPLGAVKPLCV